MYPLHYQKKRFLKISRNFALVLYGMESKYQTRIHSVKVVFSSSLWHLFHCQYEIEAAIRNLIVIHDFRQLFTNECLAKKIYFLKVSFKIICWNLAFRNLSSLEIWQFLSFLPVCPCCPQFCSIWWPKQIHCIAAFLLSLNISSFLKINVNANSAHTCLLTFTFYFFII